MSFFPQRVAGVGLQAFRKSFLTRTALWTGGLALAAVAVAAMYTWSERSGYAQLDDQLAHQLALYGAALDSELGKHEYLPGIVALDNEVQALLEAPARPGQGEKANKRLASLNVRAGSLAIFVADMNGRVRSASNWYQPESFVGKDLSTLPYFLDAAEGKPARYFSRSTARDSPEYYFSQPILHNGVVRGVAVVKISLDPIESTWIASVSQSNQQVFFVLDENNALIIASTTKGMFPDRAAIRAVVDNGARLVRWPALNPASPRAVYAAQTRGMSRQGWHLVTLANASSVRIDAWQNAFGTAVMAAFLGLLAMFMGLRRRAISSRLAAREALQRAHDELEQRIVLRTTELHETNQELLREIGERKHAEQVLRESQDDLMHASKLALLGQMSAGITHEISQPLTALRSLSFNTTLLLQRGDTARIEKNLQSISDLTERMGRLTEQLKSFSRKTPLAFTSVRLSTAVDNMLLLLENRIRMEHVALDIDVAEDLVALCDGNRLEQVLINLAANAIDAMHGAPSALLAMRAWRADGKIFVRLSDSGPGIPDSVLARLFEPFFTTKPQGEGLGLGLAISADIVREFGGSLRAYNFASGAAFEFDLTVAEEN